MLLNIATRDYKFCYFSVVRVGFVLYVFDLYIDLFDGNHGCKGNMLDAGKNCSRSIEGNFMMNKGRGGGGLVNTYASLSRTREGEVI